MQLRIDLHSSEPLFEQIAFAVKDAVARGDLQAGDKLPSVRELASDLAINPNTVVRAYDLLTRDGVVVRRQGAGCFITGKTSSLNVQARRRQLTDLVQRAVTETFHLGFTAAEVRTAFEESLAALRPQQTSPATDPPQLPHPKEEQS
jgi:GntR family transcriptional regulator